MFRAGNEDAVALQHVVEGSSRKPTRLLCCCWPTAWAASRSGAGCCRHRGETARKFLLEEPPFCGMSQGATPGLAADPHPSALLNAASRTVGFWRQRFDVRRALPDGMAGSLSATRRPADRVCRRRRASRKRVMSAIHEANHQVFRPPRTA